MDESPKGPWTNDDGGHRASDAPVPPAAAPAETGPPDRPRQPALNLPPLLTLILALLVVLFVLDQYVLSSSMRSLLLFEMAFTPLRYVYPLADQGLEWLWTPVTYSLLHGSIEHLLFNGLWLAAFGAPVLRRIGASRFIVFWALSAAAAAFFHAGLNWGEETILIGASGVISALMAAACRFAFPSGRFSLGGSEVHRLPRQTIIGAMRNRTVLIFTILWFLGNILIAVGIPLVGADSGPIAWDAHVGGFVFGYLLFGLFDPVAGERPA
ncbi:rhomboid family intramembrane serine protease [Rhizobium oryzicola]|uniref:Rhomboid family intramembrane serine protease n=1 Tax=Rhizobium oryzicola TaxID=1232668 RepID=A0ABT8SZ24_9HYPH|nr:rhomboid family intramembrane serine protease [Rhizobium oryzicola]MDO1583724.1 rhomboid family intramembrane serine protease [Rhizobium oryzicola]